MSKRLINFRNTSDFARVEGRTGTGIKNPDLIWSSCNTEFGGKGNGGSGGFQSKKISTAFGPSKQQQELKTLATGIAALGIAQTFTGFLAPIGIPVFFTGVAIGAYGGSLKFVTFSKPCHAPHEATAGYHEPTFEEFKQEQADKAYIATATRTEQP